MGGRRMRNRGWRGTCIPAHCEPRSIGPPNDMLLAGTSVTMMYEFGMKKCTKTRKRQTTNLTAFCVEMHARLTQRLLWKLALSADMAQKPNQRTATFVWRPLAHNLRFCENFRDGRSSTERGPPALCDHTCSFTACVAPPCETRACTLLPPSSARAVRHPRRRPSSLNRDAELSRWMQLQFHICRQRQRTWCQASPA